MAMDSSGKQGREDLKGYFKRNTVPTQEHFEHLINAAVNQRDDGLVKSENNALELAAAKEDKTAIKFYENVGDAGPAWALNLLADHSAAGTKGLVVRDKLGNARLSIDSTTGTVGVGALTASGLITAAGGLTVPTGKTLLVDGSLNFGTSIRQMVNLWSTDYGIGVQGATTYFRSTKNFAFYVGGAHANGELEAGGGVAPFVIKGGSVGIGTMDLGNDKLRVAGSVLVDTALTVAGNVNAGGLKTTGSISTGTLTATGAINASGGLTVPAGKTAMVEGIVNFGWTTMRQMLNLWSGDHGIGVQSATTYFRTSKNFAFYKGGQPLGNELDPGGGAAQLVIKDGSVGIGTTSPIARLQVVGGAIMPAVGNDESSGILFPPDPGRGGSDRAFIRYFVQEPGTEVTMLRIGIDNDANDVLALYQAGLDRLVIRNGNVAIGTADPGNDKLRVAGSVFVETTLTAAGLITAAGPITAAGHITANGGLTVSQPLNVVAGMNVQNGTPINASGEITAAKVITANAGMAINGDVQFHIGRATLRLLDHKTKKDSSGNFIKYAALHVEGVVLTNHVRASSVRAHEFAVVGQGTKNFEIDHPLDPQRKTLVHASLEGPEAGVYYRGEGQLNDGRAVIALPSYFEALTRKEDRTVIVTPRYESDEPVSGLAASAIVDGRCVIRAIDRHNPSQRFYWEVKGVRADVPALEVERAKRGAAINGTQGSEWMDDHL
jgi:hypothetical protein